MRLAVLYSFGGIFEGAKLFQDPARYPAMPTPRCGCAAAGFADRVPRTLEREDSCGNGRQEREVE